MLGNVIAAISTPPGKGGVAVIRMSGEGALKIAEEVFFPISKKPLSFYKERFQVYGYIINKGIKIDDGMATYFLAPKSYTGEETVEISCHGGILITRTVLETLFEHGAVPAEKGEFTRRAFISGKLTLTEAEAIGNLLEAKSFEQIKLASSPARVKLNSAISEIKADLTSLMSSIYARIDYPDEDLGEFTEDESLESLLATKEKLSKLIKSYRTGRAINEGIRTVLCGKPNVGKSTIYNLLSGEDVAIVTDIEGTTRDILERTVPLGRVLLNLADTAGLRSEAQDRVEKIGIERTRNRIQNSELILCVFDSSSPFDEKDNETLDEIKNSSAVKIALLNKADGESQFDTDKIKGDFDKILTVSAKDRSDDCIGLLTECVDKFFTDEMISSSDDAIVSSARQHSALVRCESFIDTAIDAYRIGLPQDAASSDIEMALSAISEVDGRSVSESVVDDIFSKFCVGK